MMTVMVGEREECREKDKQMNGDAPGDAAGNAGAQAGPTGIRAWQQSVAFLLGFALVISRRPDAVFHAQFWNEDGHVFFADAYNFGWWSALFRTYEGYYHALPRIGADIALLFPLQLAPLVLNLIAICVQVAPVNLLLSSRLSMWGSLRTRMLLAGVYLALPNSFEIDATITNSQWVLALISFLLLTALPPPKTVGRILDACAQVICGLSGPFCIFLSPIALFLAWKHRERQRWVTAAILCGASLVQAWSLLNGGFKGRPHIALGASFAMLGRVLAGQLYLGTLLGRTQLGAAQGVGALIVLSLIAAGGTLFLAICFLRSGIEMRLLLIFSAIVLAASMIAPTPGNVGSWWPALALGSGARYWFLPDLAVAWSILLCAQSKGKLLQAFSLILLCAMCLGAAMRWEEPRFLDARFEESARSFESAPAGTAFVIPESTPGWNLVLIKRASRDAN